MYILKVEPAGNAADPLLDIALITKLFEGNMPYETADREIVLMVFGLSTIISSGFNLGDC